MNTMNIMNIIKLFLLYSCFALNPNKKSILKANYIEGDLSGTYQLSGLWKLYIEPISQKEFIEKNINTQLSWSGNIWNCDNRKKFNCKYINLNKYGTFYEANDGKTDNIFYGTWHCNDNELIMIRKKYGYNSYETYYGLYNPYNNTISGTIVYGAIDQEYSGQFIMKNLMSTFNPIIKNEVFEIDTINTTDVLGDWRLEYESDISYTVFDIKLYSNLTWESINYEYKLIGNWNLYNNTIDLTTALNSNGNKLWLLIRRFQNGYSGNNNYLEQDRLYTGIIQLNRNKKIKQIYGKVSIGIIDPEFIGNFRLKKNYYY